MLRRGQVDHVKAERNVLAEVDNPFIVRLYYSFQVCGALASILDHHGVIDLWHACLQVANRILMFSAALQDDEFLYLVMEYLPGGDVMVKATVMPMHPC